MTDLLPCPFCPDGGKPYIDHSHDPDGCYWAKVKCHTCGASSRGQWASDRSDACPIFYAEVREEWNRRAQPAPGAEFDPVPLNAVRAAIELCQTGRAQQAVNSLRIVEIHLRAAANARAARSAGKGEA